MALMLDSFLLELAIIFVTILGAIYLHFKFAFTYWKKLNVAHLEPSFPFGNFKDALLLREDFIVTIKDIYRKLDGHRFCGIYTFTKASLIIRDPDLIKDVLVKDFSHFHDREMYMNEEACSLSGHIFSLPGTKWKNLRAKLTPTFTSGKMKMMFQTLLDCGKEFEACLEDIVRKQDVIEVKDLLARYTTDVISSCALGIQCNCLKNENAEFRQWGRKITTPTARSLLHRVLTHVAPCILDITGFNAIDGDTDKYFWKMVVDTVKYREREKIVRKDFMHLLIQLKNKGFVDPDKETIDESEVTPEVNSSSPKAISMESLAAQAFIFYAAGFETSSSTMAFCLYELSVYPDIQERLREEIDMVTERYGGNITYDSLSEMAYLDKVISETLRKYPIITILNRKCTQRYTIPETNVVVKPGTSIIVPVMGLHYDPKYFPNPERFDPERFSEEEKEKRHNFVYLPFGEGPRICIGMRFGLMQTKVGLVTLLLKYRVGVSEKTPVPLVLDKKSFLLAPVGGLWLKITNR